MQLLIQIVTSVYLQMVQEAGDKSTHRVKQKAISGGNLSEFSLSHLWHGELPFVAGNL